MVDAIIKVFLTNSRVFTEQLETHGLIKLFPRRNETYFRSMPSNTFMERLIQICSKEGSNLSFLDYPIQQWKELTGRGRHLRHHLVVYISWNVAILLLSLVSLSFVPLLMAIPGVLTVLVVISISVALSTLLMVLVTLLGTVPDVETLWKPIKAKIVTNH